MDSTPNLNAPAASPVGKIPVPRLPPPPPPEVVVWLTPKDFLQLDRLTKLTGHTAGEAAEILLHGCLFPAPAASRFQAAAQTLRALYARRRRELPVIPTPSGKSASMPAVGTSSAAVKNQPKRIHVPLSPKLNQRLYDQALESGLSRDAFARELLTVAIQSTHGLACELEGEAARLKDQATPAREGDADAALDTMPTTTSPP